MALPALPPQLKGIQHYLRAAQEHEQRDPVVSYYCRLYAMQEGMKLDSSSPESRKFLARLMDQLESTRSDLSDNDSISQEVVGNAHVDNYALKLFLYADGEDRAGRFHKNMVKSFYTAGLLIDVLAVFGELSDENVRHRKYARWKSTYIHNCLKNGETPQSGPLVDMDRDAEAATDGSYAVEGGGFSPPLFGGSFIPESAPPSYPQSSNLGPVLGGCGFSPSFGSVGPDQSNYNHTPAELLHPPTTTGVSFQPVFPKSVPPVNPALLSAAPNPGGHVHLTSEDFSRAQKYCRYAGSALQYEDVPTAIQNLQKALQLLITGKE